MKFNEVLNEFIKWKQVGSTKATMKGYELDLRQFCLYLRNPKIDKIKLKDIVDYFNMMEELGWKHNGFLTKSIAMRKFFEYCSHQRYNVLEWQLIPVPKRDYKPPRVVSEEEYKKLLRIIPRNNDPRHIRNLAIVRMLWDTGVRVGELVSLDLDNIDLNKKTSILKTEKSRNKDPFRQIFWSGEANKSLKKWIRKREELADRTEFENPEALFVGACRWQLGKRLTNSAVGIMLRHYSSRAEIPNVNAHSFRHRFGVELAKKGANNSIISNLLGHASLTSSYQYTRLFGKDLEKAYKEFLGNR